MKILQAVAELWRGHNFDRQTDGQMDGQTSWTKTVYLPCITGGYIIIRSESAYSSQNKQSMT